MYRKEPKIELNRIDGGNDFDNNNNAETFSLSIDLHEKLKLLNYFDEFTKKYQLRVIHRYYFLIDHKTDEQFNLFIWTAYWLVRKYQQKPFDLLAEKRTKTAAIDQLSKSLKQLNYSGTLNVTHVNKGYGRSVLEILNFLIDKVLEVQRFKFKIPTNLNFDEIPVEIVNDSDSTDSENDGDANNKLSDDCARKWYEEVNKIVKSLKNDVDFTENSNWRTTFEEFKKFHKWIAVNLLKPLRSETDTLIDDLNSNLKEIENREKVLTKHFEPLLTEYRNVNDHLLNLNERHEQLEKEMVAKNQQLHELNESIDDLKGQLTAKESSVNIDGAPILELKNAISLLTNEIKEYDLRIDILEMTLLQHRVNDKNLL